MNRMREKLLMYNIALLLTSSDPFDEDEESSSKSRCEMVVKILSVHL